jgi:hypothetical protein
MKTNKHQSLHRHLLQFTFLVLVLMSFGLSGFSQSAVPIVRKDVVNATVPEQRKYVQNMPAGFIVTDLINYPGGRSDAERFREPGVDYLTDEDFYNVLNFTQRLQVLLNPTVYMVVDDVSDIPTMVVGQ